MDKNLTKKQITKIKSVAESYIIKYNEKFSTVENYKKELDDISNKLNKTVEEIKVLQDEENKMYKKISEEFLITMNELKDMIMELFDFTHETNL